MCISLVARLYILQKGGDISTHSFFHQLLIASFGARLGAGGQEYLELRVRKHHRSHVAPVRHQPRRAPESRAAYRAKPRAPWAMPPLWRPRCRSPRCAIRRRPGSPSSQTSPAAESAYRPARQVPPACLVVQRRAAILRGQPDQAVEAPLSRIMDAQRRRHALRHRALAGSRRAVDGDDGHATASLRQSASKYSGKVLATHFGSLMRTATPPSAASEKHIAMR